MTITNRTPFELPYSVATADRPIAEGIATTGTTVVPGIPGATPPGPDFNFQVVYQDQPYRLANVPADGTVTIALAPDPVAPTRLLVVSLTSPVS